MGTSILIVGALALGGLLAGLLLTSYRSARNARREDKIGVAIVVALEAVAAAAGLLTPVAVIGSVVLIAFAELGFKLRRPEESQADSE
jgi:hypothetical protein